MKGNIADLMQQAQNMQAELQKAQEELARAEVRGEAGAGLVSVVMTGRHDVKRVSIDDSVFAENKEILEDLLAAAVNDAVRKVVFLSLLVTYFFFFEYLRPVHSMHTSSDLEEYYYPLTDYAYQAIHQGRFPLWDPTVYTGMSFLANPQTELFYPPAWVMFAHSRCHA